MDVDYAVDFSKCTQGNDRVAVIATVPLTENEEWKEFKRGELLMFDGGLAFSELRDCDEVALANNSRQPKISLLWDETEECAVE